MAILGMRALLGPDLCLHCCWVCQFLGTGDLGSHGLLFPVPVSSYYKDQTLDSGPALLQHDLFLVNYTCKDSFWRVMF